MPGVRLIAPLVAGREKVKYRDRQHDPEFIIGTNENWQEVMNYTVEQGRFFSRLDLVTRNKVATVGREVVDTSCGQGLLRVTTCGTHDSPSQDFTSWPPKHCADQRQGQQGTEDHDRGALDVDTDGTGIDGIHRVLCIHVGTDAAVALRFGHDMHGERGLTRRLRTEDLDHTTTG